jgi:peptidylprolyl isomerase
MKTTLVTAFTVLALTACHAKVETTTTSETAMQTESTTQQPSVDPATTALSATLDASLTSEEADALKHSDTVTSKTGLKYIDMKVGKGAMPTKGQTITVNYTGKLTNGQTFDSNVDPKFGHTQPFSTAIGDGQVIPGWDEGMVSMKVGGKRRLIIPPQLGYGARGAGATIPPNATLIFDVELLGVK